MVSLFVRSLGNCKDCDKRTTETGKSKETIREIIIHDNPPGIQNSRLLRSFCSTFYSCFDCFGDFVSVVRWFRWFRFGVSLVSAVSVVSFRWFRFGVPGFSTCPICKPARHARNANFAFKSKHPLQIALINSS